LGEITCKTRTPVTTVVAIPNILHLEIEGPDPQLAKRSRALVEDE
jgi:hypothetical protein